ncbi:MAG: penicillin-binding protein 2, partial [Alphaproteobacteria bacterium]
ADEKGHSHLGPTVERLANLLPIASHARERIIKEARHNPSFRPILVAEGLSWDQFSRINIMMPDLPGIQPEIGEKRDYPYGSDMSHVLGYVARVSDSDIESFRRAASKHHQDLDPELEETLRLPTFRIGKSGIESAFEDQLRGTAGARHVEVNAFGREIKELGHVEGTPGLDVNLTIDAELQSYVMARVEGQSAAVTVMDISNGDILAIASAPGFDPDPFAIGLTPDQWAALRDNELNPLINKTIAGQFPPGSTFKICTALAGLSSGAVNPDQIFHCSGSYPFGNRSFHCWKKEGHGPQNMHLGIKNSCDVYFYNVARLTGVDQIAKTARALGLGTNYNFVLPGTKSGVIPDRAWKLKQYKVPWFDGETLSVGIGQGYVTATPLQLAVMVSRLANGGKAIMPRLVRALGEKMQPNAPAPDIGLDPDHIAIVKGGMNGVSNEPGGTAYAARITQPGFELCGKTGSAQVRVITAEERVHGVIKNEDLPWKLRDHALFVAFAPAQAPRYAISVLVEHGGGGAKAAAPIGRDVLLFAQQKDPLSRVQYDPTHPQTVASRGETVR